MSDVSAWVVAELRQRQGTKDQLIENLRGEVASLERALEQLESERAEARAVDRACGGWAARFILAPPGITADEAALALSAAKGFSRPQVNSLANEVVGMDRTDALSSVPQTQPKANRAASTEAERAGTSGRADRGRAGSRHKGE